MPRCSAAASVLRPCTSRRMTTSRKASGSSSMQRSSSRRTCPRAASASGSAGGEGDHLRPGGGRRLDLGEIGARADPAQPSERHVDRDPREPGAEPGVAAKAGEPGEGADIGLLHHVLGLGVVAQDAARHPEQQPVVAADEHADRALVAARGRARPAPRRQARRAPARPRAGRACFPLSSHGALTHGAPRPRRRIASTDGKAASATAGRSPAGIASAASAPGSPTTSRPTIPACSCGMQ